MIKGLKFIDGLHIASLILIFATSIIGMLPFWLRIYTPIFMFYHYYPAAMALGLYSCHRFHADYISIGVITIIGCFISFVWWCLWLNEYNQAGVNIVEGVRNYSYVAGSNRSLQINTSQVDDDGPIYISMSTLDIVVQCFLVVMSLALAIHTMISIANLSMWNATCNCPRACLREKQKYEKLKNERKTGPVNTEDENTGFRGRGFIYAVGATGMCMFFYYLVASVILLVDSVFIINPIASPNTIFVYCSFASMGMPDLNKPRERQNIIKVAFGWTLLGFWLWSLALAIVQISQLAIWRMDQTPYISETNGICPGAAIRNTLTYSADEEWGNFSFSGFSGIDKMTLHNNTLNWTPQLFATYSCADDSLTLAQIGISFFGAFAFVQYMNQDPSSTR